MAKRAKKVVQEESKPVKKAQVTFQFGDRVEVTVDGERLRSAIERVIGCSLPGDVAAVSMSKPSGDDVVITTRHITAAQAAGFAKGFANG